jgi:hypothetical protein
MSRPIHLRRAGLAFAVGLVGMAAPAAAHASAVDLGTVGSFVALGGATVTNTGPSVLTGDLGVAPGTALVGFGLPAVVNGAVHDDDGVAAEAQLDLTTAYDVAAGQPVAPADDLTGQNLGNKVLTAGAYRFTSSAQLTGALTLDAQGDPNAQFVFEIGSALTTASASSVLMVNGASPCNVYWQVGTSAMLGSTTAFQGNLMALASISLDNGASVVGRVLARNGQISLINNVLSAGGCGANSTPTPASATQPAAAGTPAAGTPAAGPGTSAAPAVQRAAVATRKGTAVLRRTATVRGTPGRRTPGRSAPADRCITGFRATVHGAMIKRVVFRLDGRSLRTVSSSPFQVLVKASVGRRHNVTARVTFKDATRARTLSLGYRACAAAVRRPARGPSQFTG